MLHRKIQRAGRGMGLLVILAVALITWIRL